MIYELTWVEILAVLDVGASSHLHSLMFKLKKLGDDFDELPVVEGDDRSSFFQAQISKPFVNLALPIFDLGLE